jgi:uncharacterized protein
LAQIFKFSQHSFLLLAQKAIYWEAEKTLIVADLHLGKASHFRKAGLAIPMDSSLADYDNLGALLKQYEPCKLLILGDLFHSDFNNEWRHFGEIINQFPNVKFDLIIGNHDILGAEKYKTIGLNLLGEIWIKDAILFSHHPLKKMAENQLNFCGHIHPGVSIVGFARQKLTMPCFYFKNNIMILPAFGALTGLKILKKEKSTQVFGISGEKIYQL